MKLPIVVMTFMMCVNAGAQSKVLFVTSNAEYYRGTTISAANHFEEIVVPYDVFTHAGYDVDFVSPLGGAIPIGYINSSDSLQKTYLYDGWFMDKLEHTQKPQDIHADDYSAIYYSGGGSAMFGIAEDSTIQQIARTIFEKHGVISSVCHGTAGLANLKDSSGKSLYQGKKITGYPDKLENREMEYYRSFPFKMDEAIEHNGGEFVFSEKGRDGFFVVDGSFVTGQDPTAARSVAKEVVAMLNKAGSGEGSRVHQSDLAQINEILLDYIEGTANGQPERLRKAFHPDFNLYTVAKDTLWIRSGEQYISNIKVGEKSNRIGRVLSIDVEKDAAVAKAEILIPGWRTFTDYFLILKYQGAWKIVQKSYSWREEKTKL
ncbi:MAG: nuclear transport factor 2 family protein [Flavobacteriales bacterium]|nr:nuclear transport factor 2 family protein [Flavobacteriales bacterium]